RDWSERSGNENKAQAIAHRAIVHFSSIRDAQIFALIPPAVQELGQSSGFDVEMEDRGNLGHDGLMKARAQFMQLASASPLLSAVRPNGLDDTAQLHIDIDRDKASALGVSV